MNIIKFKDIVINDPNIPDAEWFNTKLRGKYAYWLRCNYVIALDDITTAQYEEFEETIENIPDTITYADLSDHHYTWLNDCIDWSETDRVNDINVYIKYNSFIPDDDITMEELKKFRTWLASNLLVYKPGLSESEAHVLDYYANGMYDDIVKWLTEFGAISSSYTQDTITNNCGCGSGTNLSSLYNTSLSNCDSIAAYKADIKKAMIQMFSNIDFWADLGDNFLQEIINYLNNIIHSGLSLVPTSQTINVFSCSCLTSKNPAQQAAIALLKNLVTVFEIFKDPEGTPGIAGNKLFITQTLSSWASDLYEIMEWN